MIDPRQRERWIELMHFVGRTLGLCIWTSAVVFGVIGSILSAFRVRRAWILDNTFGWDVYALIVSVIGALTAVVIIRGVLETHNLYVGVIAAVQLAVSAAAIVLFRTRWRPLTQGFGAIGLGIFSFLTGFSIGLFVLPFAVALGAAAIHNNDPRTRRFSAVGGA